MLLFQRKTGIQENELEQSHVVSSSILLLLYGVGLFGLLVLNKDRFDGKQKSVSGADIIIPLKL